MTLIGLAVGSDVFRQDAHEIMKIVLSSGVNFEYLSDDPQVSYLISAWARICKILGAEFAQYLDAVMPAVMATAEYKPDVSIVNGRYSFIQAFLLQNSSIDEQTNEEDEEWNYISLGDERSIGIKTAGLEDKVTACEMIVCYARELGGNFSIPFY